MQLEEGITKVLTSLSKDVSLQEKMASDPEGAVKSIVGDELTQDELSGLVKGTSKLFANKDNATGFMGLLGVEKCIPGLAALLTKNGGLSLLINYISGGMSGQNGGTPVQTLGLLSELLSKDGGTSALIKLIGRNKKGSPLPDLNSMMAMMSGSSEKPKKTGDAVLDALTSLFGGR